MTISLQILRKASQTGSHGLFGLFTGLCKFREIQELAPTKVSCHTYVFFHQVTGEAGYVAYKTCTPIFDQLLRDKFDSKHSELRIIDAGAGTGIVGKVLQDLGYTNIDALDISQKMLDEAKKLNVYKNFFCAPLSEEPVAKIANDQYDALICIGTLTVGHVKPRAFDEILRIVKPGKELRVCLYKVSQPHWQGWPAFDTVYFGPCFVSS